MADPVTAFGNVIQILQTAPGNYKRFGIYWWPLKRLMVASGLGPDQLYMLGGFQDTEQADMVPAAPLAETLEAAFDEYRFNATYPYPDGRVETPDGEFVTIYDEDAGL